MPIARYKLDNSSSNPRLIQSASGSFVAWFDYLAVLRKCYEFYNGEISLGGDLDFEQWRESVESSIRKGAR